MSGCHSCQVHRDQHCGRHHHCWMLLRLLQRIFRARAHASIASHMGRLHNTTLLLRHCNMWFDRPCRLWLRGGAHLHWPPKANVSGWQTAHSGPVAPGLHAALPVSLPGWSGVPWHCDTWTQRYRRLLWGLLRQYPCWLSRGVACPTLPPGHCAPARPHSHNPPARTLLRAFQPPMAAATAYDHAYG